MRNRLRLAAMLSTALLSVLVIVYLLARALWLPAYADLEIQNARQDVERVLDSVANEAAQLDATAVDYANWDDIYRYAANDNPDFLANFTAYTLTNLRLNLVIILDVNNRVLYSAAVDLTSQVLTTLPDGMLDQLAALQRARAAVPQSAALTGTVLLPDDVLLVAVRPILTTEARGPAHGLLIVGRSFDAAEQDWLASLTHLTLRWQRADEVTPEAKPPIHILVSPAAASQPEIKAVDDYHLVGRVWLLDVNDNPALLLEIELPRTFFQQGQSSLAYFMGMLTLLGLVSSGLLWAALDRSSVSHQRERENEARYRSLFQYSPVALLEQDFSAVKRRLEVLRREGVADFEAYFADNPAMVEACLPLIQIADVNAAAIKLYGAHDRPELLTTLDRILPTEAHDLFKSELISLAANRSHFDGEGRNQRLDGQRLDVRVHWLAAPGSEATLTKVFVAVEDITAYRAAEAALRLSEERYRLITENVSDTVWLMDLTLKITFISPSVAIKRGYTLKELQAMTFDQHLTPASLTSALPVLTEALTPERLTDPHTDLSRTLELEFYKKDGSTFWSEATFTLIRDEHGAPAGLLGVGRDITQRKQRERELEALLSVAASLRAAPTRGDLMPAIVNQVMSLLHMDSAALILRHPVSAESVVVMARGDWESWTGWHVPLDGSVTGQVMATGRPYLNNAVRAEPLFAMADRLGAVQAAACAPLLTQEAVIGTLWVGRYGRIQDGEFKLLIGMTEMAANALYRVGLVETLELRVADRTRELSKANQRLQDLDRAKDLFVSNVNHELRTPLANIKLYLNLLERGKPESHGEYMQTLRREQARLEKMIDDLLDLSQLDLGATRIEPVPTQLDQLLRPLVADRINLAIEHDLSLDYEALADLPLALADPERLAEVVTNLVTNAINYTPRGGNVTVRLAARATDESWVTITVTDTGPGITPGDLPHLFERFYRGEAGRRASAPGTGLGLAISKEIIERLGGHITVESVPSHGATFTVWLRALRAAV